MTLSSQQQKQEDEYNFPYHYLDLARKEIAILEYFDAKYRWARAKEFFQLQKGMTVLDAGCGDGRFVYELRNSGAALAGIDYSKKALAFAAIFTPTAKFKEASVTKIPLPKESLDCVACFETLEHLPLDEVPKAVAEFARVLKTGGKLVVSVPSINLSLRDKHYQHFSGDSLRNVLGDAFTCSIEGHQASGIQHGGWWLLRLVGNVVKPFHRRIPFFFTFIRWYYRTFQQKCSAAKGRGLIAFCVKK